MEATAFWILQPVRMRMLKEQKTNILKTILEASLRKSHLNSVFKIAYMNLKKNFIIFKFKENF
jgi:hypothetical protein